MDLVKGIKETPNSEADGTAQITSSESTLSHQHSSLLLPTLPPVLRCKMGWAKKVRAKARKELRKARNVLACCFGGAGHVKVCRQIFGTSVQLGPA